MRLKRKGNDRIRYVTYLRCSTDEQADKEYSTVDAQRELVTMHVKALGGELVREYADEGRSGTNLDRPGWKHMLIDAEAGEFDAVCVTYMSRLGRGDTFVIAQHELKKHGVAVELVKEKFTNDLAGYMGKTMTTMMDGVYPKMVSQWTRTKMERMVERGYHCGGITPFGYMTEVVTDAAGFHSADKEPPKRLMPHPDQAPIVLTAFDMAANGSTLASIRAHLNEVSPAGRTWTITTVRNLLSSETYKGVQTFGEWRNESAHAAIVNATTWEAAQTGAAALATRHAPCRQDTYTFYLRGLVSCPYCGCAYTMRSNHGRNGRVHYYVCKNANRGGKCPVTCINADKLHTSLIRGIEYIASHKTVTHKIVATSAAWSNASAETVSVRGQLAKRKQFIDMQIGNLTRAIGEGRALDSLLPALEKAEAERTSVILQLETAEDEIRKATLKRPTAEQVQEYWGDFAAEWPGMSDDDRTTVLGTFLLKVEIESKERAMIEIETIPNTARSVVHVTANYGSSEQSWC